MHISSSVKQLFIIAVVGIALRIAWVYSINTQPVTDFKHYNDLALSLVHSRGYTLPEGLDYIKRPTPYIQPGVHYASAFRPPGYPLFLAALYLWFPTITAGKAANVALGGFSIVLMFLLARRYWSDRVAAIAAALSALFIPFIAYTSVLGTEILSIALLLGALCLHAYRVGRRWDPLLAGILVGALSLVKPYFIVFPAIYATLMWWRYRQRRPAASAVLIAILAMAVVIAPWTVRNYVVFRRFVPISTNGDFIAYINNNDRSTGTDMDAMAVPGSIFTTNRILNAAGEYNEADAMRLARSEALRWITHHPWRFLTLGVRRLAISYGGAGGEIDKWSLRADTELRFDRKWVAPILSASRASAAFVVVAGWSYAIVVLVLYAMRRPLDDLHKINVLLVLFLSAVIFVSEGQPRFVFPAYPFFILGISWAIDRLWERAAAGSPPRTSGTTAG